MRAENLEANAKTNQRIDDMRAEVREANGQTNQRIDDMRATVVAIIPRAAAEPGDAPSPRGSQGPQTRTGAADHGESRAGG